MSYKKTRTLPSLTHPLIISPEGGTEKDEIESLPLPPFPEVDLTWPGFTLSHLHWVGIKAAGTERYIKLAINHEFSHKHLSVTPFSMLKKYEIVTFYSLALAIIQRQGSIRIPVLPDETGDKLQEQWHHVIRLHEATKLIEEVYAIHSSLRAALQEGTISNREQRRIIKEYKTLYGEELHLFSIVYDAFDLLVNKIGGTAAVSMVFSALSTLNPSTAFLDIISDSGMMRIVNSPDPIQWTLSGKDRVKTPDLSQISPR
jgi:hypothetical protein